MNAKLELTMRAQSHTLKIIGIATCTVFAMSGALTAPASARPEASDLAKTLYEIQKLSSLTRITPLEIVKEFHADVALRSALWSRNALTEWSFRYFISGDFGFLEPVSLDVAPKKSYDISDRSAIFTATFRIDGEKICVSPNDLSDKFDHKLTAPKVPPRPYEHRHCENGACLGTLSAPMIYNLHSRSGSDITFEYYKNYCLDQIILKTSGMIPLEDRERKSFEFITPAMTVPDAKIALARRGFYCDPKMIPGPSPGNDAFACEAALPPNAFDFKSQSVEIWQDPGGRNITDVLIISSGEPPKRALSSGS